MVWVYFKKMIGITIKGNDHIYLTYLYSLERCGLRHVQEEKDCFKVITENGVYLYLRKFPSSDAQVLYQIWTENEYAVVADLIEKNFRQKQLRIVDAGANIGYASLYLFKRLKDQYDIEFIIVEPGTGNLEVLTKNFEANGLINYHIEKAGLFNKECFLALKTDFRDGKDWSLRVEEANHRTDLRGVEVLSLIKKYNWEYIDFIKIDIEGSEKYLFEDDAYAAGFLSRIKLISIEVHEEFISDKEIVNGLTANSFDSFSHGEITIGHNLNLTAEN